MTDVSRPPEYARTIFIMRPYLAKYAHSDDPHPNLLPQGEGTRCVSVSLISTCFLNHAQLARGRRSDLPLPEGEDWGEGRVFLAILVPEGDVDVARGLDDFPIGRNEL